MIFRALMTAAGLKA
ncbi:hypothetical protein NLK96_22860 [Klebsiella pneumoniae]|nr:hypothetical protein [Klebsiella pneumoniae]